MSLSCGNLSSNYRKIKIGNNLMFGEYVLWVGDVEDRNRTSDYAG